MPACVQIGTASGFMRMAMSTVALILSLVQHAPIRALFLEPTRAAHCAHLCMHLIQQLLVRRDGGSDLTSCTEVPISGFRSTFLGALQCFSSAVQWSD